MYIALCSPFKVEHGGLCVEGTALGGSRVRLTFAYLVLEREREIPRDQLAELLWPLNPPAAWPSSLREVLSRVRRILARVALPGALVTHERCVRLLLPADAVVDVEQAIDAARRMLEAATAPLERLQELAGSFRLVDSASFLAGADGPWVAARREELQRVRMTALERLADARLRAGDADGALGDAQRLVDAEPLRESGHHLLMRGYALAGRRVEALQTFHRCRELLADQLGIDPPAGMKDLHLQLLRDELTHREQVPPHEGRATPPSRPRQVAVADASAVAPRDLVPSFPHTVPLTGRNHQLDALCAVPRPGVRVLLLEGETGAGKTRLLAEARAVERGGMWLSGRCVPDDPTHLAPLVRAFLRSGLATVEPAGERDILEAVAGRVDGRPLAVVLDDVQWIDRASARVVATLAAEPAPGPLTLLLAYRTDDPAPHLSGLLSDLYRCSVPERLTLPPLVARDVETLVCAALGPLSSPQARSLAHRLMEETAGTPFYLVEVLAHLRATGWTNAQQRRWPAPPASIVATVTHRLAGLSAGTRRWLGAAAVAGPRFGAAAVTRAADQDRDPVWLDAVEEALAQGFVEHVGRGADAMRFRQNVVRRVILSTVGRARTAELLAGLANTAQPPPARRQRRANGQPAPAP